MFRTLWVHLGPFGCLTELSAKLAKLVQKFVQRSRVGIFRNERTRSTPLDPKIPFWCVLYYLAAFGTVRCEKFRRDFVARTFALVRPVLHRVS